MIEASLLSKAQLGLTLKRNRIALQFTGQQITTTYKLCCCYSHLDLLEYKSGLFPMNYFWVAEPSHSVLRHTELFPKLYIQDDYHLLDSFHSKCCRVQHWELK